MSLCSLVFVLGWCAMSRLRPPRSAEAEDREVLSGFFRLVRLITSVFEYYWQVPGVNEPFGSLVINCQCEFETGVENKYAFHHGSDFQP